MWSNKKKNDDYFLEFLLLIFSIFIAVSMSICGATQIVAVLFCITWILNSFHPFGLSSYSRQKWMIWNLDFISVFIIHLKNKFSTDWPHVFSLSSSNNRWKVSLKEMTNCWDCECNLKSEWRRWWRRKLKKKKTLKWKLWTKSMEQKHGIDQTTKQ